MLLPMSAATCELTLLLSSRRLSFRSNGTERAHIFRRVGGEQAPWQRVAVNTRSPFLDEDVFAPGTFLEYYVHVQAQSLGGTAQDHSCLVSITVN